MESDQQLQNSTWVPASAALHADGAGVKLTTMAATPGQTAIGSRYAQVGG